VSDVVATILLLALTVTLFASIFAFVTAFPAPLAQNNNQFQASLVYGSNSSGLYVAAIHILHLAGPVVAGNAQVFLKSSTQPNAPEFQNPYTVSQGLSGATVWNLGQVWNWTFSVSQRPTAIGNNITIYLVAGSQLLFSVILPGAPASVPPTVVGTWIAPSPPAIGQGFTVYATTAGVVNSVTVGLASVPGGPSTAQSMSLNAQGQWTYTLKSGATKNGTYYGFVTATGAYGQQAVSPVAIWISPVVTATTLTVSPTSGSHSSAVTVTLTGAGFSPSTNVLVSYNGVAISPSSCTTGNITGTNLVTVTGQGAFVCTYSAPTESTAGTYEITAADTTSGQIATAFMVRT
jgi:hypothetical protein